jgi:hypothetical protein
LREINKKLLENFVNLKLLDLSCNKIRKIENLHNLKVNFKIILQTSRDGPFIRHGFHSFCQCLLNEAYYNCEINNPLI